MIDGPLPNWILPMSAVDYDNDGLLDVYLGAYLGVQIGSMAATKEAAKRRGDRVDTSIPGLDERVSAELTKRLLNTTHPFIDRPGPPNLLLRNVGGGRFAPAPGNESLGNYYNTLATTWSDFDRDGDMDLYVTNEAGPNQLMRNEGDGTFADISTTVTGEVGFGMGMSWGDYDNDGRQDMYLTNMYSKAGIRITKAMKISYGLELAAKGNSLIRNGPDGFVKVSGHESPHLLVEAADFGWGGAFADLNNDGYLDIYSPAGQSTMPKEVASIGET